MSCRKDKAASVGQWRFPNSRPRASLFLFLYIPAFIAHFIAFLHLLAPQAEIWSSIRSAASSAASSGVARSKKPVMLRGSVGLHPLRGCFFIYKKMKKLVMGCCARAAGGLRAGGRAAPTGSAVARCGVFYGRSTVGPRFLCFSSTDFVFLMVFGTTVGPKLP